MFPKFPLIKIIRYSITEAVKHWKDMKTLQRNERVKSLKNDILNGPFHVFGDHGKCARYNKLINYTYK